MNEKRQFSPAARLATLAMLLSAALMLSFLESRIPAFVAIPGVKLGLANVASLFALYALGPGAAILVSLVRASLSALLFGNFYALAYSLAGATCSFFVMWGVKKIGIFSPVGVSVAGGAAHNVGQIAAACVLLENGGVALYLPVLLVSGTVAGVVIGLLAGLLLARIRQTPWGRKNMRG